MLDHIGLQVQDVEKSLDFYLGAFAAIGMREVMRFPAGETIVVGLGGADGQPVFWLGPPTGTETRELHVAFQASDRIAVDAVHEAAVAAAPHPDPRRRPPGPHAQGRPVRPPPRRGRRLPVPLALAPLLTTPLVPVPFTERQ